MPDAMTQFARINSHSCAFLTHLGEPRENELEFRIEEARTGEMDHGERLSQAGLPAVPTAILAADERAAVYEISFDSYVAYCVTNESFVSWNAGEEFTGTICRIYTKSFFREFVERSTFARDDFPGPLQHYGFICLNHIVDVVSASEPTVTVRRPIVA